MVCVECAIKNNQSEGLEETVEEVGQGKIGELKMEGGGGGGGVLHEHRECTD